jgi:hypothetical protein
MHADLTAADAEYIIVEIVPVASACVCFSSVHHANACSAGRARNQFSDDQQFKDFCCIAVLHAHALHTRGAHSEHSLSRTERDAYSHLSALSIAVKAQR